jgi:hypothetical protein
LGRFGLEDVAKRGHETPLRSEGQKASAARHFSHASRAFSPSKVRRNWALGGWVDVTSTCVDLAAQSVPHSKPSTPAGFWLLLYLRELGPRNRHDCLRYFPIRMDGQVSPNRRPHVVGYWSDGRTRGGRASS